MAHTFTNLLVHAIFSTKDRHPFLNLEIRPRLFAYIGGILRDIGCVGRRINGPDDHVHLLLSLSTTVSVAEAMRLVKTNSSKWIHETFPTLAAFGWQTGYAAFGVSASNAPKVEAYIDGQEEHHRTMTFQEELIQFLDRHGVKYDPRYVWQ